METQQMVFWKSSFGSEYTDRNNYTVKELNDLYIKEYGISRTLLNETYLKDLQIDKILEVGCNVGNQLRCLQNMNYGHLYGIELQSYAVEKAKELTKGINIVQASAFDIPFKDHYFDLVFTSGVLIHISPKEVDAALDEIYRVSRRYIWGFEYYSDNYQEVSYRGNQDKLWKANFAKLYMERYPSLRLVREEKFNYLNNSNVDQMFLFEKSDDNSE